MRLVRALLVALVPLLAPSAALAVNPDEVLSDPALEERARQLSKGLRCVVCQNQSIDDSDAGLARDMRLLVRERLVAGDTDAEVRDYLVARYGEFVLLRPPVGLGTVLLWGAPAVFLLLGAAAFLRFRSATAATTAPLSRDEETALATVLSADEAHLVVADGEADR